MKKFLFILLLGPLAPAYATWDTSTPTGTEAKSLGDDRIRELKTDIQTTLQYEGDFPGSDTSNPRFIYTPSSGTTAGRPTGNARATGMVYINKSSNTVEQYNGTTWDVIGWKNGFPSGTKMPFFQASCPDGWTQDTSVGGQVLRSTSSAGGGTGGSADVSTNTATHSHTVNSHTHSISASGTHTHTTPAHVHTLDYTTTGSIAGSVETNIPVHIDSAGGAMDATTWGAGGTHTLNQVNATTESGEGGGTSGADGNHDHTGATGGTAPGTDTATESILKYMNVIICTAP